MGFSDQGYLWLAALVIVPLAAYAGYLLYQLNLQKKRLQAEEKQQQQARLRHDKKVLSSVLIIVRAMQEEQCDLSEGCWRLSVLLQSLKASTGLEQDFPAIFELYEKIKHMPILEERKKLAKQQRMKLDLERMKIEAELKGAIADNLKLLFQFADQKVNRTYH